MIATLVDVGALWQTVWTAAVGGVLVTVCCSVAVLGAARAQEHRAARTAGGALGAWLLVAAAGSLAMATVILYSILLVVD